MNYLIITVGVSGEEVMRCVHSSIAGLKPDLIDYSDYRIDEKDKTIRLYSRQIEIPNDKTHTEFAEGLRNSAEACHAESFDWALR